MTNDIEATQRHADRTVVDRGWGHAVEDFATLSEPANVRDDGAAVLRRWAMGSDEFTPEPGCSRFNFVRDIGRVRLVMLDSRNGRVLEPGRRRMIDDDEWRWVVESCWAPVEHLLIGTSVPAFVPRGMHDLQVWTEAIGDGGWGGLGRRIGEKTRIKADMEDWPSFNTSFGALVNLLATLGSSARPDAPATIAVLSGDIHFSYAAQIHFPSGSPMSSTVHQLVNSPIRNALTGPERTAMHIGMSRSLGVLGCVSVEPWADAEPNCGGRSIAARSSTTRSVSCTTTALRRVRVCCAPNPSMNEPNRRSRWRSTSIWSPALVRRPPPFGCGLAGRVRTVAGRCIGSSHVSPFRSVVVGEGTGS